MIVPSSPWPHITPNRRRRVELEHQVLPRQSRQVCFIHFPWPAAAAPATDPAGRPAGRRRAQRGPRGAASRRRRQVAGRPNTGGPGATACLRRRHTVPVHGGPRRSGRRPAVNRPAWRRNAGGRGARAHGTAPKSALFAPARQRTGPCRVPLPAGALCSGGALTDRWAGRGPARARCPTGPCPPKPLARAGPSPGAGGALARGWRGPRQGLAGPLPGAGGAPL
jgi:hypothetical protein